MSAILGRRAIATDIIDKDVDRLRVLADELSCIILQLCFINTALEVPCESFLSPRGFDGVRYRCEG